MNLGDPVRDKGIQEVPNYQMLTTRVVFSSQPSSQREHPICYIQGPRPDLDDSMLNLEVMIKKDETSEKPKEEVSILGVW